MSLTPETPAAKRTPAAVVSLVLHIIFAILLFCLSFPNAVKPIMPAAVVHMLAPPPLQPVKTEGGGGQRQPLPATKGHAPEVVRKVFTPPMVIRNESPKLVVLASLSDTPDVNFASPQIGDPLGAVGTMSGGFGGPVGIGNGGTGGIGSGNGPRQGGSSAVPRSQLTRDPELIYKEEPEFSDEARKARHEGRVTISLEVDTQGHPINIRVVQGLGMGLDEKAILAVSHWKFKPAMSGSKPVVAGAIAYVSFHLL